MVIIRVPIEPVPFARAGANGKRRFTPTKQAAFMGQFRLFAQAAMQGRAPFEGPLHMNARFVYVAPASWSRKKRDATVWKASKPDIDNIFKILGDAISGCVYVDDAQIASLTIQKRYGLKPEIIVTVQQCEGA